MSKGAFGNQQHKFRTLSMDMRCAPGFGEVMYYMLECAATLPFPEDLLLGWLPGARKLEAAIDVLKDL